MNIKDILTAIRTLQERVTKLEEQLNSAMELEKAKTNGKEKRPYKRRDTSQS
jgi:hypothetical protein